MLTRTIQSMLDVAITGVPDWIEKAEKCGEFLISNDAFVIPPSEKITNFDAAIEYVRASIAGLLDGFTGAPPEQSMELRLEDLLIWHVTISPTEQVEFLIELVG